MNETCPTCGKVHTRCKAHKSSDPQQPCGRNPRTGADVCPSHGGSAPQVAAKADERARDQEAARAVARLTLRRDIDPANALLEEVHRSAGAVAYIESRILELDPDALVWGTIQTEEGFTGQGSLSKTKEAADLNVWVKWWHLERERLVKASTAALAAGVAERQVQLAERQGALVAQVIRAVLDDLDLTPEQSAKAARAVPARLRLIS